GAPAARPGRPPVRSPPRVRRPALTPPAPARPRGRLGKRAWQAGIALSLALAAAIPALCLAKLWPFLGEMPTWDEWSVVEVWSAHFGGRPVLPLLLAPYNGHYNLLPRFIFYGLGLLTHWNLHAETMLCYLSAAGILLVLLRMLWETRPRLLVLAAPVAAYVFSLAQYNNLLYGYPFGQWLGQLAATVAIYLLTRPAGSRRAFAGAVALARVGAGTIGVTAVHRRVIGPFFLVVLGHPLEIGIVPTIPRSAALGGILLVAFLALVFARWRGNPEDPLLLRWGGVGLLAICSALLIAAGRSSTGLQQSLVPHYVTAATPLVLAVLVLAFDRLERAASAAAGAGTARRLVRPVLAGLAAAALLVAALVQPTLSGVRILPTLRTWMEISLAHDVRIAQGLATDAEIRETHFPVPAYVRSALETLRANRLAWYAPGRTNPPARP